MNRAIHTTKTIKVKWCLIGVYIVNRTLWLLGDMKFLF